MKLETAIVESCVAWDETPREVAAEFRGLLATGHPLSPDGRAKEDPQMLARRYAPSFGFELFGTRFYLAKLREDENFRYFVAYVLLARHASRSRRRSRLHPRIFYKDSSLVWRSATHYIRSEDENWVGKGDLKAIVVDGEEELFSAEETTNLPYEMQAALDELSRRGGPVRRDLQGLPLVLRNAPDHRLAPYRDFSEPRRRANADPRNRINGGDPVAWFERADDPTSLRFTPGFEPDFSRAGVFEKSALRSRIYGGEILKYRILSSNRTIQYQFIAAPHQVWIIPPQTLTTELSSYGVRTIDVNADEDFCLPGYEYHFVDDSEDPPELFSQIPKGFAGAQSEVDPDRADASPWIEQMPVIREFRRKVLGSA